MGLGSGLALTLASPDPSPDPSPDSILKPHPHPNKVALGGFGAQVFLKALKDRVLGGTGNIASRAEAEREELLHRRRRELTAREAA